MVLHTIPDPRVTIIAAVAANGAIGRGGKLLYRLPADLRRFKLLTTGNTVIMGRRTYESLPHGALPDRRNIVLSRQALRIPGCDVHRSLDEALRSCGAEEHIYIIGGAQVYAAAMSVASLLCLTLIGDTPADADTFFPALSDAWTELSREDFPADEMPCKRGQTSLLGLPSAADIRQSQRHAVPYSFVDYVRRGASGLI